MDANELQSRVKAFPRWHYRFELGHGVETTPYRSIGVNRQEQRRRYLIGGLLDVTEGSLEGRRVLDLGCNSGFFSLAASEAGANFVHGVDGRQMWVDQANLVFEARSVAPERYHFEVADIFRHEFTQRFDVVLCVGLMYHISKPMELFELFDRVGAETIVIDTEVTPSNDSVFRVNKVSTDNPMTAVDHGVTFYPSRQAVMDLAAEFGYQAVPLAPNMTNYEGMKHYRNRTRLGFICAKGEDTQRLSRLSVETRSPVTPATVKFVRSLQAKILARTPRGRALAHGRRADRARRESIDRQLKRDD
jgi:SAM-dependent methyltransferase